MCDYGKQHRHSASSPEATYDQHRGHSVRRVPPPYGTRYHRHKYVLYVSLVLINIKIKSFVHCRLPIDSYREEPRAFILVSKDKNNSIFFSSMLFYRKKWNSISSVFSQRGMMLAELRGYGNYHNHKIRTYFKS